MANTIEEMRRLEHAEGELKEKTRLREDEHHELEVEAADMREVRDSHGKIAKLSEADSVEPEGAEADRRTQRDKTRDTMADPVETMAFVGAGAPEGDGGDDQ